MKKSLLRWGSWIATMLVSATAFAQETGSNKFDISMYAYIAAGIAIGVAVLGGALGQGRAAAAALEGIARNPNAQNKIFVPMLLALAFIESLVILAFLIANGLAGK